MAILIDETSRALVHAATGHEARALAELMQRVGTNVVAVCAPHEAEQQPAAIPAHDSIAAAVSANAVLDVATIALHPPLALPAAIEAIDAGVPLLHLMAGRIPVWDAMQIHAAAAANGATVIGPGSIGALSPGRAMIGRLAPDPDAAQAWFRAGPAGVISRSGGMTTAAGYQLARAGVGVSTLVHVGGEAVPGLRIAEAALLFEDDPATHAIAVVGEIGGTQEEELAQRIADGQITKPVVAFVVGRTATEATRFSHPGAIIESGRGAHAPKARALAHAGANVLDFFADLPDAVARVLREQGVALAADA